jgi:hypothetical protein
MKAITLLLVWCVAACSARAASERDEHAYVDREQRRQSFESMYRVLDAHPSYVDEMYEIGLQHRRTLDRLFENTARGAARTDLAQRVATQLVAHPRGLERVLVETLDAARDDERARDAIMAALAARPELVKEASEQLFAEPSEEELAALRERQARNAKRWRRGGWPKK